MQHKKKKKKILHFAWLHNEYESTMWPSWGLLVQINVSTIELNRNHVLLAKFA